jgi:hypothetical protein
MEQPKITVIGTPPRMIKTLLAGFNTVANHVYLIIFPIAIDLLLWLGPKLHLKALLSPLAIQFTNDMLKIAPSDLVETVKTSQTLWTQILEQFNLASAIRTFPVGIPSLIARFSSVGSPLAWNPIIEIPSINWAVATIGILLTAGFLLGSLYFYCVARETDKERAGFTFVEYLQAYVNSVLIFGLFLGVAILVLIPLLLILSILSLVNAGIAQFFVLLVGFGLLWLLVPLVFSIHGVFVLKKKAMESIMLSIKMVRFFLPGTGLFVMTSALISELLNKLWILPEPTSWLTLFGIGGHSFIITGLLTGSFIYYREGLRWMQDNMELLMSLRKKAPISGGTTIGQ